MSETYANASGNFDIQRISDILGRVMRDQAWALKELKATRGVSADVRDEAIRACTNIRHHAEKLECLKEDQVADRNKLFREHEDTNRREERALEGMLANLREMVVVETTKPRSIFRRIFG